MSMMVMMIKGKLETTKRNLNSISDANESSRCSKTEVICKQFSTSAYRLYIYSDDDNHANETCIRQTTKEKLIS